VDRGEALGRAAPSSGGFLRWLLLQFLVLGLCFFQDGHVGIGVPPQREEILISSLGFGGIALHASRQPNIGG
jgi:hypothetical protein